MSNDKKFGVLDLTKDALKGEIEYAAAEEKARRLKICEACEHLSKLRVCKVCGCFVDAKTRYQRSSCPIKKW